MELRVCVFCGEERPVERPECLDGHGGDCPEAFCADCGAAVWTGPTVPERRPVRGAAAS